MIAAGLLVVGAFILLPSRGEATHTERAHAGSWDFSIDAPSHYLGPESGTINFRWVEEAEGKAAIAELGGEPPSGDLLGGPNLDCYGQRGAEYYVGTWTLGELGSGPHAGCKDSHNGILESRYTRNGDLGEFIIYAAGPSGFRGDWQYPHEGLQWDWTGEFTGHFAGDNAGEAPSRRRFRADMAFLMPGKQLAEVRAAGSGSFTRSGSTVRDGKGFLRLDFGYRRASRRTGGRITPFVRLELESIQRAFETAAGSRGLMWNAVVSRSSFPRCKKGSRARLVLSDLAGDGDWLRYRGPRGCGPRRTWQDGPGTGVEVVQIAIEGADGAGCSAPASAERSTARAADCDGPSDDLSSLSVAARRVSGWRWDVAGNVAGLADARLGGAVRLDEEKGFFSLRLINDHPLLPDQDIRLRSRRITFAERITDPAWMAKRRPVLVGVSVSVERSEERRCARSRSDGILYLLVDRAAAGDRFERSLDAAYLRLYCRKEQGGAEHGRGLIWANRGARRVPWVRKLLKQFGLKRWAKIDAAVVLPEERAKKR